MKSTITKLPKSMAEISIEIPFEELEPWLKKSAEKISENAKIEGFRPGKAPYDIVVKKFGEMAILQEAIDEIIRKTYYEAVKSNNITPIGQPQIDIEKVAPNNPFSYKATVAILPTVKIGDLTKIKIKKDEVKVGDKEINTVLEEIRSMRAKEEKVDRPAESGDLVKFDFNVYRDGVPIENGANSNYPLIIGEKRFIPGFEENLIGLSVGDEKEFKLKFPAEYHEKSLAGKPAEFKVKVNEIAKIIKPELTDELAKEISGGNISTLDDLKANILKNMTQEEEMKADRKLEIQILEEAVKVSEFEDLPEVLVHEEIHRMIHELEESVAKQGLEMESYLASIKKTIDDLEHEMEPQAELRAKTSILSRAIYQDQKMEVTPDEVEVEIAEILKNYPPNEDVKKQLNSEQYKEYLSHVLGNRKVMDYLKKLIIK